MLTLVCSFSYVSDGHSQSIRCPKGRGGYKNVEGLTLFYSALALCDISVYVLQDVIEFSFIKTRPLMVES